MGGLLKFLFDMKLIKPVLQPITRPIFRLLLGLIAIPIFRFLCKYVFRVQDLDDELEKDLEQWFKASLVLLAATKNMEMALFGELLGAQDDISNPWVTGLRILMAIGVTEMMPDQELFAIMHPGPPKLCYDRQLGLWKCIKKQTYPFVKGVACQHLNRSSPVFAILCTIFPGPVGWFCFFMAISQYLIIGLVTSRDRVLDVLSEFDRQVEIRRKQLKDEFQLTDPRKASQTAIGPQASAVATQQKKRQSRSQRKKAKKS